MTIRSILLFIGTSTLLAACGGGSGENQSIEPTQKWCWSMQSDSLKGTFTTNKISTVNGAPSSGNYVLTDASVYESAYSDIEIGSVANGMYVINQPNISIVWNGNTVTSFTRADGMLTNGFSLGNGIGHGGNDGAYIVFEIRLQAADTAYLSRVSIFSDTSTTPSVSPVGVTGKCPGQT